MLTQDEAQALAKKVVGMSSFPEIQVTITAQEQAYTRFANNGITTASFALRHNVNIVTTRDARTGSYATNDLDDASLKDAVKKAEELAAISPPNPERLTPVGPQKFPKVFDFDERTANARSPEMIPHVKTIIDAAMRQGFVAAGLVERSHRVTAIANNAGLFGYHNSSDAQLTTTIRAADGSSSGWAGEPAMKLAEIDSARLAATAIGKCKLWKNPQKLAPGNYTVVLEPTATGDLVRLMSGAFSARATEEGRTFLSKRGGGTLLGEKVFPEFVTLRSDPFDPRQPSSPWTGDWLPAQALTYIDKGVIANLGYDRYWAEKTNREPTPNGGAVVMDGGDSSVEDLIKTVDRGLLVTHFWYIRFVNTQTQQYTGLTRDGLFLIENGKITEPVMNFRFNDGPLHLLQNAVRIGKASRMRGLEGATMVAPALVANEFSFTSISDAV